MTDAPSPQQLTERQERILALIVQAYVTRPEPVGSKALTELGMNFSSATIRNEMAALEELGFISQPHTSAGRVPTESGYRYFVRRLLDESALSADERRQIAEKFQTHTGDLESGLRLAVATLARTTQGAALVTKPQSAGRQVQFKHLELISTQGRLVLMVLVMYGGSVRQQMLTLAESLSQEALSAVAARFNSQLDRLTGEQIRQKARTLDTVLDREIMELVAETLSEGDGPLSVAYREGLPDILNEFEVSEGVQQAVRVMEEENLLDAIVGEPVGETVGGVKVVIGGEGRWQEVRHLSLILSRYGVNDQVTGMLAVLGPTRMHYGRAIASVRHVAGLMSGMMINFYGGAPDDSPASEKGDKST
jgi:heat-inducible transcriptional repressor